MGNRITSREGFVSDKLIYLGKQLQVNYDGKSQPDGQPVPEPDAERAPELPRAKLAERSAAVERSEAERLHRELSDRIGHDSAAASAELEHLAAAQQELTRYRDFLEHTAAELGAVDTASPAAIRRLEEIRYRCFTANGRAQIFFGGSSRGSGSAMSQQSGTEYQSFASAMHGSLPLVLAIIAGALIVGAAVLLALH